MSRPAERARASGVPFESHPELEELEDQAIVAHETAAHLPQKRAQVTEEARSIVISEPNAAGQQPFRVDRAESTVVVDRRDLEAARHKILQRRGRDKRGRRVFWAVLAAAAFLGGGLVVFLSMRAPDQPRLFGFSAVAPALNAAHQRVPGTASSSVLPGQQEAERLPPKVSLEELPLERPRRRQ